MYRGHSRTKDINTRRTFASVTLVDEAPTENFIPNNFQLNQNTIFSSKIDLTKEDSYRQNNTLVEQTLLVQIDDFLQ